MDGSSRNGQVSSLDWWLYSGIPVEYTESALEMASSKNQLDVLQWWKDYSQNSHIHLKIGRVMDMASTAGHVDALEWWSRNQPEITYDKLAMYHASCHGRVDVLQWWLDSGLQLIYDAELTLSGPLKIATPVMSALFGRLADQTERTLSDAVGSL